MRASRYILFTVAVVALGAGCSEKAQREFRKGVWNQQYAEMQESVKPVHSRTIAQAVGLMAPPGASALNGVCHLHATDVFHRAVWSNPQLLENADEDVRHHFDRVRELYSILRLFSATADGVK